MRVEFDDKSIRERKIVAPDWLYQYDYGLKLEIAGIPGLPVAPIIHFSTNYMTDTIKVTGATSGGVAVADIPDELLINDHRIVDYIIDAYLYVITANTGKTEYRIEVPVKGRQKKSDTAPTPQERSEFDEVIAVVNAEAKKASDAALSASEASENAERVLSEIQSMGVYIGSDGKFYYKE